jgi:hypothetical protein
MFAARDAACNHVGARWSGGVLDEIDGEVQQLPVESAVRIREDNPADLVQARAAVTAWRDQNPAGTGDELVAAVGRQFTHYGLVLRAVLFAVDRHRARQVNGIADGHLPASRGRT